MSVLWDLASVRLLGYYRLENPPKETILTNITVIDTETATVAGGICEVAFVSVSTERKRIMGYGHSLIFPDVKIDPVCQAAHHIRDEELIHAPTLEDWVDHCFPSDRLIAAHNAAFDREHMGDTTPADKHEWICTWKVAEHLYPDSPRHGNQVLRYYLGLDVSDMPEEAGGIVHRALYDTWCTAKMVLRMLDDCHRLALPDEDPVSTLLRLTTAPLLQVEMRFGNKHRGKTWEEVARTDKSYLYFMRDKCTDLDENTKHSLNYWLDKSKRGEV